MNENDWMIRYKKLSNNVRSWFSMKWKSIRALKRFCRLVGKRTQMGAVTLMNDGTSGI